MKKISVILADDHGIMRAGLRQLLEANEMIEVVAEAADGLQAVAHAAQHDPDIVVMDLGLPGVDGIEATRRIHEHNPRTAIIGLSTYVDAKSVTALFRAGARGYVAKECMFDELLQAVDAVRKSRVYITPMVADAVLPEALALRGVSNPALTDREIQVLKLLAQGYTLKAVAGKLDLNYKTVHGFRRRLTQKLNIHTDAGLTKYAIREGLIDLDSDGDGEPPRQAD